MKPTIAAAVLLPLFLLASCAAPTGPRALVVSGTVRYLDGHVAAGAWVRADGRTETQADAQGHYSLTVRTSGSIVVWATERREPDQLYVGTWSGNALVTPEPSISGHLDLHEAHADIVLDLFTPI